MAPWSPARTTASETESEICDAFLKRGGAKLLKALSSRWADKQYADLQVTCGSSTWNLHKIVVCGQSEFFENACKLNFKEGLASAIDFPDDDSRMIETMLWFFYHHDYDHPEDSTQLVYHVMVYAIADKYCVVPLVDLAFAKFKKAMSKHLHSPDFAPAIRLMYTTTSRDASKPLRDAALAKVARRDSSDRFPNFIKLMRIDGFQALMVGTGEFATDVASTMAEGPITGQSSGSLWN